MKRELKIISTALPAGTPAPEVALKSTPDQIVKLSEFRGRSVVLVFYPADWSPVCGDQVVIYNELLGEFRGEPAVDRDALADVLLGLSSAAASDASIVSADLNPLIVVGGRPVAVDALVEVEA